MLIILLTSACTDSPTVQKQLQSSNLDADEDGYVHWSETNDPDLADCDDNNPEINPLSHRFIASGSFLRGNNYNVDTAPEQQIYLQDYCIDRYERSNLAFVEFMNTQRQSGYINQTEEGLPLYDFEDDDDEYPARIVILEDGEYDVADGYADHPIVEIYRWSALAFCWYHDMVLPTEAQWERAARGDDGYTYPWGEDQPSCELANYWPRSMSGEPAERCIDDTMPITSYPNGQSPFGLYNMAGNVSEWVQDWYQSDYYSSSPDTDPNGPDTGWSIDNQNPEGFEAAVARGGSLGTGEGSLRSFHRSPEPSEATSNGMGFRCSFSPR